MKSPALLKGWCPGACRPMQAKDGLIMRIKITGGRLSSSALRALAQAARAYGSGIFDLTGRANLQMRGVRPDTHGLVIETLDRLGLFEENASAEAVRNILVSPLSGLDGGREGLDAARALERMLAGHRDLHALPAKFGFLIDDGSRFSLASIPADIRFDWVGSAHAFAIGIGGRGEEVVHLGRCDASEIPAIALRLARAFLNLAAEASGPPRRMRELVESCGADAIAAAAGLRLAPPFMRMAPEEPCPLGLLPLERGHCFGAGVAFGHLDAMMLEALADAAHTFGRGEIRLTPWRCVLVPVAMPAQTEELAASLASSGFLVDRDDPRLAITACRGALTCEHGSTDTRADALALMHDARKLCKTGIALHVSGCIKRCGQRASTPVTLVARGGLYDLAAEAAVLDVCIDSKQRLTLAQIRQHLDQAASQAPCGHELAMR